ncbi:MAG: universal stress protein [Pseudomonadota bacterium]
MLKILVYTDGRPESTKALYVAAELKQRMAVEMGVITVRSGTHATEKIPLLGVGLPLSKEAELPPGIQMLAKALKELTHAGLFSTQQSITVQEVSRGHLFVCNTRSGEPVHFFEKFGHTIEELNHEVAESHDNLVIVSLKRRGTLGHIAIGDPARALALDLHTSIFIARGGGLDSRFLICADGSPSSRRIFPLLRSIIPAIGGPVIVLWVRTPRINDREVAAAKRCLEEARQWLNGCGKEIQLIEIEGERPLEIILEQAKDDSVVVMGSSLKHDLLRRMLGSLPIKVLSQTKSSVLLVKRPPEGDIHSFEAICKGIQ